MFFDTVLPLLGTLSYLFVYRALNAPQEYIGFVVMGGAMTAFWLNMLWGMASQLYWDKDAGNLEVYIASPAPLPAILLGMAAGGLVNTAARATAIMIICSLLFGVSYATTSLPLLVLVFTVTMVALYGMGMLFASIYLVSGREAWHISNMLQEPIYLASGFFFPVQALGTWVATFASIIPLTLGLDAMRQLVFPVDQTFGFLSVGLELLILTILSLVFMTSAIISLAKLEQQGRQEGRLIERRR
jgi:ABC-2 type transport system permease protein